MSAHNCETCPLHAEMASLGAAVEGFDRVVALAGNPNTGKSTLFNALTRLRQHTGNWPGKTVTRAEGGFEFSGVRYKLVDLPVVPVAVDSGPTYHRTWKKRGTIRVHFGEPIPTGLSRDEIETRVSTGAPARTLTAS